MEDLGADHQSWMPSTEQPDFWRRVRHASYLVALAFVLSIVAFVALSTNDTTLLKAATKGNPRYKCHTTEGDFVIELFLDSMPLTAYNFMDLADSGFYNGIHFHRVIDNFMVQFGCPFARHHRHPWSGTGGPPPSTTFRVGGYSVTRDEQGCIPDEFTAYISNVAGTLSMANKGDPNSGGSQFFINVVNNQHLDWWRHDLSASQHPVFAKVVEGWNVVRKISKALTDAKHVPIKPIRMISVTRVA